jgi:hypothetical protein
VPSAAGCRWARVTILGMTATRLADDDPSPSAHPGAPGGGPVEVTPADPGTGSGDGDGDRHRRRSALRILLAARRRDDGGGPHSNG